MQENTVEFEKAKKDWRIVEIVDRNGLTCFYPERRYKAFWFIPIWYKQYEEGTLGNTVVVKKDSLEKAKEWIERIIISESKKAKIVNYYQV